MIDSPVIYYFSGTGNSLHVAELLKAKLPNSDIIPVIKAYYERKFICTSNKVIFVFPCHGLTIPIPVKKFIQNLEIDKGSYISSIVTRGGTVFKGNILLKKLLNRKRLKLNSSFLIDMISNDPKFKNYSLPDIADFKNIMKKSESSVWNAAEIIESGKDYSAPDTGVSFSRNRILNTILELLIPFLTHNISPKVSKYFYYDKKCTGCGVCEKVCPSSKIMIIKNEPVWQKKITCYLCYSCLNYCPQSAVQIYSKKWMRSYTGENPRYHHPECNFAKIAKQKV